MSAVISTDPVDRPHSKGKGGHPTTTVLPVRGESMNHYQELEIKLQDLLTLQQQIRLFAMTSLTEDNPFRPMIEKQACESVEKLRGTLEWIREPVSNS